MLVAGDRYRMLDTLRAYGAEWLGHLDQSRDLYRRHFAYYLRLAQRFFWEWKGPDQIAWSTLMSGELANLRAAFDYCWSTPAEYDRGLDMATSLIWFWVACGHLRDGRLQLDRALDRCLESSPQRTLALWAGSVVTMDQGDHDLAENLLTEGALAARTHQDESGTAYLLAARAQLAFLRGDMIQAHAVAVLAERLHRSLGDPGHGVLLMVSAQALTLICRGPEHLARAETLIEELRQECDSYGELWTRSYADHHLAELRLVHGDIAGAEQLARRSLEVKHRMHDHIGTAMVLDLLVRTAIARSDGTQNQHAGVQTALWHLQPRG